jgi:hypothetical protein
MADRAIPRALAAVLLLGASTLAAGCVPDNLLEGCCAANPPPPTSNPTPTPSPSPSPNATVGAVARPTLGDNPPAPFTPADEERIANSTVDETATLRMVQAARSLTLGGDPKSNVSDDATNAGGAKLVLSIPADDITPMTARFTLGNAELGVNNVLLTEDPSGAFFQATLPDGRIVTVGFQSLDKSSTGGGEDFLWTAYGGWGLRSAANIPLKASPVVLGTETPDTAMPTSGSATFNGFVEGNVTVADGTNLRTATLKGDATITADFAAGTLAGAAPNISATPLGNLPLTNTVTPGPAQAWNGLTFNGNFTTGLNGFTGTTAVSSAPGNSYSMLSSATGFFTGRFFGPGAEELGAVWNIYDGNAMATGVLVGGR